MAIQWVSGAIRFLSGTGVWSLLCEKKPPKKAKA